VTAPVAAHRWSGWPGAWCLDCGAECAEEVCIGEHEHAHVSATAENPMGVEPQCRSGPCPEPGSDRHNPYARMRKGVPE
jgi:hypothetical protein